MKDNVIKMLQEHGETSMTLDGTLQGAVQFVVDAITKNIQFDIKALSEFVKNDLGDISEGVATDFGVVHELVGKQAEDLKKAISGIESLDDVKKLVKGIKR